MSCPDLEPSSTRAAFHTTRWSMVLGAQGKSPRDVRESLETLCRQYWPPLYAYVRHRGHSAHDAQDLTQEFFARLLAKGWLTAREQELRRAVQTLTGDAPVPDNNAHNPNTP